MKHVKMYEEFNESVSMDAVYIHQITGCGQNAAQNFIDDNGIDSKKLAAYVKQHRDSKEKYDVRDMISGSQPNPRLMKQFLNEQKTGASNLEMIGPGVDELLDAINRLNGAQLSGEVFKFRDNVKLEPVDKSGHVISNNKFSIEVIPAKGFKNPIPDENAYMREANKFLEENGFKCKIYKTK